MTCFGVHSEIHRVAVYQDHNSTPTPTSADFHLILFWVGLSELLTKGNLGSLSKGLKVLEAAVGATSALDQVLLSKNFSI